MKRKSIFIYFPLLFCFVVFSGCQAVNFTQRRLLSSQIMEFDSDPMEAHFYGKSFQSREGSVGGFGGSAGGGCGCY